MNTSTEEALRAAAQGLLYPSETDAPFEAFTWPASAELTPDSVRAHGGHAADAAVNVTSFDELVTGLTTDQAWHDDEERAAIQQYRQLFTLMRERLKDLQVLRVGAIEVTLYLVGRTPEGEWSGLSTQSVET